MIALPCIAKNQTGNSLHKTLIGLTYVRNTNERAIRILLKISHKQLEIDDIYNFTMC